MLKPSEFAVRKLKRTEADTEFQPNNQVDIDGILKLADEAGCSCTAAAIRAVVCSAYPLAVIVSQGEHIAYAFMSNTFKDLDKLSFLRKGMPLPDSETLSSIGAPQMSCMRGVPMQRETSRISSIARGD